MFNLVSRLPYLASAASALIFGFSFLFTKNALDSLDMLQLLGPRFLVAALFMLGLKALGAIKISLDYPKIKQLLIVAVFQPICYFVLETIGVDRTSASESGILISLIPMVVAVLAVFVLQERLRPIQWLAAAASVGGVFLITMARPQGISGQLSGILALLGAVLAGSLYSIYSKKASSNASPVEVTYVMMWVGAVVFNGLGVIRYLLKSDFAGYFKAFTGPAELTAVLYLGVLSSVAAFFCMNYSLAKLEASRSSVFINLTPVVSVVAGVAFRSESFLPLQVLGAAIILVGVWGVNAAADWGLYSDT